MSLHLITHQFTHSLITAKQNSQNFSLISLKTDTQPIYKDEFLELKEKICKQHESKYYVYKFINVYPLKTSR